MDVLHCYICFSVFIRGGYAETSCFSLIKISTKHYIYVLVRLLDSDTKTHLIRVLALLDADAKFRS